MHLYDAPAAVRPASASRSTSCSRGADFGAGFWQLLAGARRARQRIRDHAHHSMAPVWEANHVWLIFVLDRRLDRLSGRVRVDRLDARRPALHRGGRDRLARRRLRAARGHRAAPRELRAIDTRLRGRLDPHAVRARRRRRRDRLRGACRSATPRGDLWSSWLNPTSITDRRARGRDRRPTSRPSTSPPTRARHGDAELERRFRTRALGAGRGRRASLRARRAASCCARRAPALRRARRTATAWPALIVSALAGRRDARARAGGGASSRRATAPALAVAAIVAGWALAQ